MLRNKTVLILGAGASSEIQLPLGPALKARIAALMEVSQDDWGRPKYSRDNSHIFYEIERLAEFKENKWAILTATRQLSAGVAFASSIDNFLEIRKDNPHITLLAKAALVHLILEGERESLLATESVDGAPRLKTGAIDGTWYQEFTQLLFEKVGIGGIEDAFKQLAIVDFNYDRCFEHVIFHALVGLYGLPLDKAREFMKGLRLYHPYGAVGSLYIPGTSPQSAQFGADPDGRYLALAQGVRTFTEQIGDASLVEMIREEIVQADSLVFLGCAFHSQNLELLKLAEPRPKLIFGTTYGMSDADNAHVKARLGAMFTGRARAGAVGAPEIRMESVKCGEFLRQFRRTLSAD
jgi:hypothetical protein